MRIVLARLVVVVLAVLGLGLPAEATITKLCSVSNPVDGVANATDPIAITPCGTQVEGDLVFVLVSTLTVNATLSNTTTGGQTWNALTYADGVDGGSRGFWCRFNGTWAASPAFDNSGTANFSLDMHVWRPTAGSATWAVDVAQAVGTFSGTAITITGQTRVAASVVTVACWVGTDTTAATWGSLSGSGWVLTDTQNARNLDGADTNRVCAHNIGTAGASNNVSMTINVSHTGTTHIVSFSETLAPRPCTLALTGAGPC